MSYIGNTPTNQNFVAGADQFSGNGSTTAFTLSRNVNTVFDIFVAISNVPQDPYSAYSVSGNTLTFTSAPPSGTGNIYVVYRATNVQTFVPTQGVSPSFGNLTYTGTLTGSTGVMNIGSGQVYKDASGNVFIGNTYATWDERLGVRPSGAGTVGIGVYSASTSYTGSIFRAQAENATGANFKLYEGRGSGGAVNYWVDGAGSAYFAGNLQFNSGYGSVATAYGCRAWVNFNGTGTVAIRASGNVSSITDNGTGDYTVNFTNAMVDANYAANVTTVIENTEADIRWGAINQNTAQSTTQVRVTTFVSTSVRTDRSYVYVSIFR